MKPETLLRLYPRAWRERYGDEFVTLLNETGAAPAQVIDIARAALVERARAIIGQGYPWPLAFIRLREAATLLVSPLLAGLVLSIAANVIANTLHRRFGVLPEFNSRLTGDVFMLVSPPDILRTLHRFSIIQPLLLLRCATGFASFFGWKWLRMRRVEATLWCAVIMVFSAARQLGEMATFGEPGFPSYARSEIWLDGLAYCVFACMQLLFASAYYWRIVERVNARQTLRTPPPARPLGLQA